MGRRPRRSLTGSRRGGGLQAARCASSAMPCSVSITGGTAARRARWCSAARHVAAWIPPLHDCDAFVACRLREVPDDSPLAALADCSPAVALAPVCAPPGITWGEALEAAVSRPALPTLEHIPKRFRVRVAGLLRDFFPAHVEAEKVAVRGIADAREWALAAARLLWLGPTLLLQAWKTHPPDALAGHEPPAAAKAAERVATIRRRVQAAAGAWLRRLRRRESGTRS